MAEVQAPMLPDAPAPGALDLKNIQGDILSGLPKKTEYYYFFQILNGEKFRQDLAKFVPLVKSAQGVIDDRKRIHDHKQKNKPGLIPVVGINIAFSHLGFKAIGIDDTKTLKDFGGLGGQNNDPFLVGQREDALASLADDFVPSASGNIPAWDPAFLQPIHGVILIAADSHDTALENIRKIDDIFRADTPRASIHQVKLIRGDVRPGDQSAHEHFGFLDGVSNPAVVGFDKELPGQGTVPPGVILTGHEGDGLAAQRDWAKDGSFLVFRHLFQEVPEFNKYLEDNPIKFKNLSAKEGSELLGARMVGRWKSGAPIDITPFKDDPALAKDPQRNNNFKFAGQVNSQFKCPFAAHIRKTNPRDDLEGPEPPTISVKPQRIVRRGIQFGPEVTPAEKASNTTQKGRGLLFVCYQSSIANGFQFQQKVWSNSPQFQFKETQPEVPGLDPLIGQASGGPRKMSGLDPNDPKKELSFPDFIIPRGGEYFFSPSLKALRETLAKAPTVKA